MKALLFDFDGLLLDTETPSFEAWVAIYREQGVDLAWEVYIQCVGTHATAFDAVTHLENLTGRLQERKTLVDRHNDIARARIEAQAPLPGVMGILQEAKDKGLGCAVASSSPREWVEGHLVRLGMMGWFDTLVCRSDVVRVKPAPDLFQAALQRLGAAPDEAVVFEDSLNGIRAARAAGIFCVAVPNAVTRGLPLHEADLLLSSLDAMSLAEILRRAQRDHP